LNIYIRNIGLFLIASVVAKAAGALLSFLLARYLQPAGLGIWVTMTLFVSYGGITTLGTLEALLKLLPFHKGKGELSEARKIEEVAFSAILIASAFVLMIGCAAPMLFTSVEMGLLSAEIKIMSIAAALGLISQYFYFSFMAHQDFKIVAMLESGRSIACIMILGPFSYLWGLRGAALGFCITELIILAISAHISSRKNGSVHLSIDLRQLWVLISVGFPITIFWWVFMIQSSVDRLVSISFLGKEATGFYALGGSIVSVMSLLTASISKVLYPRISEKLGESASEKELFGLVIVPSRLLGLILPLAIGPMVIALPLIYRILPKYLPGLASAQILVLLAFFHLGISNGVNFMIVTNRQILLCLYVLASLCVGVSAAYFAVIFGFGIEGIALSTGISGLCLALLMWRAVFKGMGFTLYEQLAEVMKLYLPFISTLLILGLGGLVFPQLFTQSSILMTLVFGTAFILIFSFSLFVLPVTRKMMTEMLGIIRGSSERFAGAAPDIQRPEPFQA